MKVGFWKSLIVLCFAIVVTSLFIDGLLDLALIISIVGVSIHLGWRMNELGAWTADVLREDEKENNENNTCQHDEKEIIEEYGNEILVKCLECGETWWEKNE